MMACRTALWHARPWHACNSMLRVFQMPCKHLQGCLSAASTPLPPFKGSSGDPSQPGLADSTGATGGLPSKPAGSCGYTPVQAKLPGRQQA